MLPASVWHSLETAMTSVESPTVRVLVRGSGRRVVGELTAAFDGSDVARVEVGGGIERLHRHLVPSGPCDLIVDLAGGPRTHRRFAELLLHLRIGGTLISRIPDDSPLMEVVADLVSLRDSEDLDPPMTRRDDRSNAERDRHALAASLGPVQVVDGFLLCTSTVAAVPIVAEAAMNDLLEQRPEIGSVVEVVPGGAWESRATLRQSPTGTPAELPTSYDAPELSLRDYRDVLCWPRQAAVSEVGVVLPESFRHNFRPRLRNAAFTEWAPGFVLAPEFETPPVVLDGPYFYLDNHVRGHFGHALTEQISHLWGWRRAKAAEPSLRVLVGEWKGRELGAWEWDLMAAAGIDEADVDVITVPVRVERLIGTSPMFAMPEVLHPQIEATYAELGAALAAQAADRPWPTKVFCSRRVERKRACHNAAEVEALFIEAGFEVVYPEDLPLADQIRLVREAEVIGGFAGSGMFQIAFAGAPKHVILIGSESYAATNEYMISSVVGHRLDLVHCRPDVPAKGKFSAAAYQSDFTFDHQREGRWLADVLSEIPSASSDEPGQSLPGRDDR
ncbi:hypothetical protein GCM10027020_25670 [Nocardioides salsibiostraticola]